MKHKLLQVPTGILSTVLALISLVSLTGTAASGSQTSLVTPGSAQTIDPTPMYSITWTATSKGFSDVTDTFGSRTIKDHKVIMVGSGIFREYAAGGFDLFPFDMTVTDESDQVVTSPCSNGSDRDHSLWHITDPNRYAGAPSAAIIITPPIQRDDGSWYLLDPFSSFGTWDDFTYQFDLDQSNCAGDTSSYTQTGELSNYVLSLWPTPGDLEGDAQGKVFTKTTQVTYPAADPPTTVQWDVTVRVLEGRDLTVDHLEVTQGLQDEANSISLVQGRRTVVRAYLGIGQDPVPVPSVSGKLSGYVGSTLLGSVPAFNPGGRITAPVDPKWQQIDHTLNFELPYAWTLQPTLRLEVEVNPDHSVAELNYANNKLDTVMTFRPCAGGAIITYVPIHYTPPDGYSPADPSASIIAGAEFMRKIYPIPDRGLVYFPSPEMTLTRSLTNPDTEDILLANLSFELLSSSGPRAERIYGWLPSLAYPDNGLAYTPGVAAFGNDTESPNRWRRTFAHEVGHNYGFPHTELTTAGWHWFDVYDRVIKPIPASVGGDYLFDVMVPARLETEAWISAPNYEALVSRICSGVASSAAAITPSPAAGDTLLVTGIINNATPASGSLDPLYHFTTVPTYTLPVGPQYCVNLEDAASTLLTKYCFNLDFAVDSGTPAGSMPFGMVVPYPAGLNRVELVKGGSLLSAQVASSNPPNVNVTFPNAAGLTLSGAQNVTWSGTDADGGTLTYNILYSRDNGASWVGIENGVTGSAYTLDFSGLPGTIGASGRIKVMVSDGFNSSEDSSDNPFTIGNKPPDAVIISPSSGATFTTGPKVVLEGAGMDLEDSSLGDGSLSWASNIDGALGSGQLLELSLSPGLHTITMTATDSGGLTSTASIQITVVEPPTITINQIFLPLIEK